MTGSGMDMENLLAPIKGDNPAGEDLRYSGVYDRIKEARRADDPLAQGEWQTDLKTADWKTTIQLCSQALTELSKDLQIAVWMTEAMLHHQGYSGMAAGLRLICKLIENYWQTLYPEIDDGDLEYRIGPLLSLNEKLPEAVFQVPVCDPKNTGGYSYFQWEESRVVGFAQNLDKEQKERRQAMIDEGKITGEEFASAVAASPIGFYKDLTTHIEQCRMNLKALDDIVSRCFDPDPPGFTRLAEAVDACHRLVSKIYKDKQKSEVILEEEMDATPGKKQTGNLPDRLADDSAVTLAHDHLSTCEHAISDISPAEKEMWQSAISRLKQGDLKTALDQLLAAASLAPSIRQKNRFQLLLAKLCLAADRPDLARPILEKLYALLDSLKLEQWEHPAWIADVIETLYRCLTREDEAETERAKQLFEKLCTLNITKAAAYRP